MINSFFKFFLYIRGLVLEFCNLLIKILTSKLYDWTNKRWIITLSKEKGDPSIKEKEINVKKNIFEKNKESVVYKKILENFPDAEMTEVKIKKGEKNE